MLHYRIRQTTRLTTSLESAHQLVPGGIVDERWRARLEGLADDADVRRVELGQRTAHEQPGWAVEALGPVPEDPIARASGSTAPGGPPRTANSPATTTSSTHSAPHHRPGWSKNTRCGGPRTSNLTCPTADPTRPP
ncbi:hypothetical protein BJF78_36420 [Pseudonocardia sp. CNS-139]|nr:hypothetical protein BJF78_36420 [Pseudonocardia sp. CNS-139]